MEVKDLCTGFVTYIVGFVTYITFFDYGVFVLIIGVETSIKRIDPQKKIQ